MKILILILGWIALIECVVPAKAQTAAFITPASGIAPFPVRLSIPPEWQDAVQASCEAITQGTLRFAGRAFSVDWGDGTYFPDPRGIDPTSCGLTHNYSVPGTYTVKASVYSFTDCCAPPFRRKLWGRSGKVRVTGKKPAPALALSIRPGKETLTYEDFPEVVFSVAFDEKSDLVFDFVASDGTLLATTKNKAMAYTGSGQQTLGRDAEESYLAAAYNSAIRRGVTRAHIEGRIVRGKRTILAIRGPEYTLSETSRTSRLSILKSTREGPFTVNLRFSYYSPTCLSYSIDWGDGSVETELQSTFENCLIDPLERQLTHVYTSPGSFVISFKSNQYAPTRKLTDIGEVEHHSIVVR